MKLAAIFSRDIDRAINPAVVVSNQKQETIDAEIREYVFTDELIEKLYHILNVILNIRVGKTGIWINGYYGSGKSHFIKYVHYCLQPETTDSAFEGFIEAARHYNTSRPGSNMDITPSNIALLKKKIQSSGVENILFNVEDETDDGSGERLTRIFLNMFNKFRGYNSNDIALALLLEKYLDEKGQFEAFKEQAQSQLGYDWQQDAADVAAYELDNVLRIAKSLVPELDTVSLHSKLSTPDAYKVSINGTLIPELNKYLATKDPNYRLVFLVDEVSQYIGANKEILLNFQNIIERVSEDCNNQVWIACTAQQTLDEVSLGANGANRIEDEFGKILGRFDTRISLQSNDAAFITQKRVLDKNSTGLELLGKLYREKKDYILHQFKISHELYKGFHGEDDFCLAYPFVPYQFKLIAHVFEAFQQLQYVIKEVKDNERSVLGITHFTIKEHAQEEVGGFIPFDAFYNAMFQSNLTHRGAKAIENALELEFVKKDPFAQRVVKALFMVSNLLESQRMTFPSNIDNLTVLLMRELDQNRMQLQKQIREVLDKLREESIIREENGSYFFFNEDEIDVQNLIKSQTIGFDDRLEQFDEFFFRKMTNIRNKFSFGQNDFRVGYAIDGKEFFRNGDFDVLVMLTERTPAEQKALELKKNDLGICVHEWFMQDDSLRRDLEWYCKTLKFFSNHGDAATGVRAKTIENFRVRNNDLEKNLLQRFKQAYAETRFISLQRVIESDQVNGADPEDRTKNILTKHLAGIYHKHELAAAYAQNQKDLKASAASNQVLMPGLTPAEELVNNMITNYNNQVTVHDLLNELEKPPFGWRNEAALDVLVRLVKKKKRVFRYRNQPRFPIVEFINKAVTAPERMVCEVVSGQEIDQATLDETAFAFRDIFNRDLRSATDGNELYQSLCDELQMELHVYQPLEDEYHAYPFGACFHEANKLLRRWRDTRDPKTLFDLVRNEKDTAKNLLDQAKGLRDFAVQFRKEYDAIQKFYRDNRENIRELGIDTREKADKIEAFLRSEDPRSDFRHIRKAYDEIHTALKEYKAQLLDEVLARYEQVFEELEAEKTKLGVQDGHVLADRQSVLQQIKRLESIAQLNNKLLSADAFKTDQIDALIRYAAAKPADPARPQTRVGEPREYYITRLMATITTEQELDEYLARARREMQELLRQHKTIIIK